MPMPAIVFLAWVLMCARRWEIRCPGGTLRQYATASGPSTAKKDRFTRRALREAGGTSPL